MTTNRLPQLVDLHEDAPGEPAGQTAVGRTVASGGGLRRRLFLGLAAVGFIPLGVQAVVLLAGSGTSAPAVVLTGFVLAASAVLLAAWWTTLRLARPIEASVEKISAASHALEAQAECLTESCLLAAEHAAMIQVMKACDARHIRN